MSYSSDFRQSIENPEQFWFRQAEKPADVEHPYGHGRAEYIATLIIATLLCVAGIEFIEVAIDRIRNPKAVEAEWWMIVVLAITIVLKEITARYAEFLSSKIALSTLSLDLNLSFNFVPFFTLLSST
jgi:divalent metal cation (Fe/Co/Zn/Cd) transporter